MASTTVTYGTISEFDPSVETITAYLEQLQLYFAANHVADVRKVPVLLTVIGPKVYTLLRGLLAPTLPKEKNYAEALTDYYEPKPCSSRNVSTSIRWDKPLNELPSDIATTNSEHGA